MIVERHYFIGYHWVHKFIGKGDKMENAPIKVTEPPKAIDLCRIFDHIFQNGFGNPIILSGIPTALQMKAGSWGIYGANLYIKFGNNVLLRFTGTVIS